MNDEALFWYIYDKMNKKNKSTSKLEIFVRERPVFNVFVILFVLILILVVVLGLVWSSIKFIFPQASDTFLDVATYVTLIPFILFILKVGKYQYDELRTFRSGRDSSKFLRWRGKK